MARLILVGFILATQFAILETGLRVFGGSEAAPAFQSLFAPDERIGYRLRPGAAIRYTTSEFSTDLAINQQGVRDDEPIGAKGPGERRVLILGDSFVFAVQVPQAETMSERLEALLNDEAPSSRWRVVNGGVQGYGPVEQWLFYHHVAAAFEPDIVLVVVSVANDMVEAYDAREKLRLGRVPDATPAERGRLQLRSVVRSSMVLQIVRQRADQLRARVTAGAPERPVAGYLEHPPPFVDEGLRAAADAFGRIADEAGRAGAQVAFILMPARFQSQEEDYLRVAARAERTGNHVLRDAATVRFADALAPLGHPMIDLLPVFRQMRDRRALHFTRNAHLTAFGHDVAARAIFDFLRFSGALGEPVI